MFSCILVRPFTGYLLDNFARRPVYLAAYAGFALCFAGYAFAQGILLFTALRFLHGFFFGASAVCSGTLISQVVPRTRVGEGLGWYGLGNTFAMCFGPLLALSAAKHLSFHAIFLLIAALGLAGLLAASRVKIPPRPKTLPRRLTRDSLFIADGVRAFVTVLLVAVPYGAMTTYAAVYAAQTGLGDLGGWFFTMMASGLVIARPLSGRKADEGYLLPLITLCLTLAVVSSTLLWAAGEAPQTLRAPLFLLSGFVQGASFGILHPSFNSFMIRLAPENRRGAATAMFYTAFDLGIGLGVLSAGAAAQRFGGFAAVYGIGIFFAAASLFTFLAFTRPHFLRLQQKDS
jgi:MFS family permease